MSNPNLTSDLINFGFLVLWGWAKVGRVLARRLPKLTKNKAFRIFLKSGVLSNSSMPNPNLTSDFINFGFQVLWGWSKLGRVLAPRLPKLKKIKHSEFS